MKADELIHRLTNQGSLRASAVACGDPHATIATWDSATVTCQACAQGLRAPCTCAPDTPPCAVCRQWSQTHRADGSRKRPPASFHHEQQFQETLRQLATGAQWHYYHVHDSRKSPSGFPDTVLVKGPRLIFAELKMPGKTPSVAQKDWLQALAKVERCETYLWYPDDLGTILEVVQ